MIKLAPLIHELKRHAWVIHTGQYYAAELTHQFHPQSELGEPDTILEDTTGQSRGTQIATTIQALTKEFMATRPNVVVVQGDTDAASAGAQAANYLSIPVVHLEAGLRSHDRAMAEEINRLVAGAMADIHCAATAHNAELLVMEGVSPAHIMVTGNTSVEQTLKALKNHAMDVDGFFNGHVPERFVLATVDRPENTNTAEALIRVLAGLSRIDVPVLFLAHPHTRRAIEHFGLGTLLNGLTVAEPATRQEFLALARRAELLVSDSGELQEQCTAIGKPLLAIRRSTERPESIDAGFTQLITPEMDIAIAANLILANPSTYGRLDQRPSPYGDTQTGKRIAAICHALADGADPDEAIQIAQNQTIAFY